MKSVRILFAVLAAVLAMATASPASYAQDADANVKKTSQADSKEKGREGATVIDERPETPLRVQIVISEFDGTQKISSLPYALNLLGTRLQNRKDAHLRFGVRVPIASGTGNQINYQDVGTNIDCEAIQRDDGEFRLDLTVDRSSFTIPSANAKEMDWKPGTGDSNPGPQPMIRSFRDDFTVIIRNGQTLEGTSAVDPVTGHVLKVEITLTVLK